MSLLLPSDKLPKYNSRRWGKTGSLSINNQRRISALEVTVLEETYQ
jgi:hypothetical protein